MKRMKMKTKIALTFCLTTILEIIIEGFYNVISNNGSFITNDIWALSFTWSWVYLLYICLETKRHKLLILIGLFEVGVMICSIRGALVGPFSGWYWNDTVRVIYYFGIYHIARYQTKSLPKNQMMKESEK